MRPIVRRSAQQRLGNLAHEPAIRRGKVNVHGAPARRIERREVAERLRQFERSKGKRLARESRGLRVGVAVIRTNTPVFGPPLCSWPVECRYRGPMPVIVAARVRSRTALRNQARSSVSARGAT